MSDPELASSSEATSPARRPFGVGVISVMLAFNAIYTLLSAGWSLNDPEQVLRTAEPLELLGIAFGLSGLLPALALWSLQRWVWVAAMLWVGTDLAISLYLYVVDRPDYLPMALSVIAVFYLNQRDVQLSFRSNDAESGV